MHLKIVHIASNKRAAAKPGQMIVVVRGSDAVHPFRRALVDKFAINHCLGYREGGKRALIERNAIFFQFVTSHVGGNASVEPSSICIGDCPERLIDHDKRPEMHCSRDCGLHRRICEQSFACTQVRQQAWSMPPCVKLSGNDPACLCRQPRAEPGKHLFSLLLSRHKISTQHGLISTACVAGEVLTCRSKQSVSGVREEMGVHEIGHPCAARRAGHNGGECSV